MTSIEVINYVRTLLFIDCTNVVLDVYYDTIILDVCIVNVSFFVDDSDIYSGNTDTDVSDD